MTGYTKYGLPFSVCLHPTQNTTVLTKNYCSVFAELHEVKNDKNNSGDYLVTITGQM